MKGRSGSRLLGFLRRGQLKVLRGLGKRKGALVGTFAPAAVLDACIATWEDNVFSGRQGHHTYSVVAPDSMPCSTSRGERSDVHHVSDLTTPRSVAQSEGPLSLPARASGPAEGVEEHEKRFCDLAAMHPAYKASGPRSSCPWGQPLGTLRWPRNPASKGRSGLCPLGSLRRGQLKVPRSC